LILPIHSVPDPSRGCLHSSSNKFYMDSSRYLRIGYRSNEAINFAAHLFYINTLMSHLA
jgi:hypothetical protein